MFHVFLSVSFKDHCLRWMVENHAQFLCWKMGLYLFLSLSKHTLPPPTHSLSLGEKKWQMEISSPKAQIGRFLLKSNDLKQSKAKKINHHIYYILTFAWNSNWQTVEDWTTTCKETNSENCARMKLRSYCYGLGWHFIIVTMALWEFLIHFHHL